MAQDILIVVDIATKAVQMYCDQSILDRNPQQGGGEGSNELAIRVPVSTELRWRATPLQTTDARDDGVYHCIIESYKLWDKAGTYLTEWGTSNGGGDSPFYKTTGNLQPETTASVATEGIDRPFIQALTQLSSRDEQQSPQVAYTFTVGIYKNGDRIDGVTWDPFVTIYRV